MTLTQSSQSVSGNYSKVRILWKTTQSGASYNNYERTAYYYVSINGGAETRYSIKYTLPKGSTKTLLDTTITVNHKTDGKGSVKVRTWMDTDISEGTIEKSQSLTLDTIPRATEIVLSAISNDMGSNLTIDLPRASSSFTHDLAYKVDGESSWNTFKTGATTTYTWTTPDLASKVPNATSLGITLRAITKSGSTTIGTKTVSLSLKVPSSVVPTVSDVFVIEAASGLLSQFGAYIQGKSKISCEITGAGAKGSTIKEYHATFAGATYNKAAWTSPVLTSAGELTVQAKVKDSRGRWSAVKGVKIYVQEYTKPEINTFEAYRCKANGEADPSGEYVAVKYKYSVTALGNKNTASMTVSYKKAADSQYTALLTNTALSDDKVVVPSRVFSNSELFDLKMELTDWFKTEPYTIAYAIIPTEEVIMDIRADGQGVAFGGVATRQRAFESFWPIVASAGMVYDILPDGTDLNTLTESNVYRLLLANTYANSPADDPGGILEVFAWSDALFQRLTRSHKYRTKVYQRFYYEGAWGEWHEAYGWTEAAPTAGSNATLGTLKVRCNHDLGLVEVRGSVKYTAGSSTVKAGASLSLVNMPSNLVPSVNAPLSVYLISADTGWIKAAVNTDGVILVRTGTDIAANASVTFFLGGTYYHEF
ncbi:MAG: hypothetical protein IKY89_05620 [Alistipes sp.]|nr:hypothetical protein [Alistipes sp.]